MATLDPALTRFLSFLRQHPEVRRRLPAPPDKTVVYSGSLLKLEASTAEGTPQGEEKQRLSAWECLAIARRQDPVRFDYVTLEDRLRQFHVAEFGESLFDHALRVAKHLNLMSRYAEATILWRALSGIYVQGAKGRVRALVLPGPEIAKSVFSLTEVQVLSRPDVLSQIDVNPDLLRDFRLQVRTGLSPTPLVIM